MRTILLSPARPRLTAVIVGVQALLIAFFAVPAAILGPINLGLIFSFAVLAICVAELVRLLRNMQRLTASAELTKRFAEAVNAMQETPVVNRDSGTIFKAFVPDGRSLLNRWTLMVADAEMLDESMAHANLNRRTFWAVPEFFGLVFTANDGAGITVTDEGDFEVIEEGQRSRWVGAWIRALLADRLIASDDEVRDLLDQLAAGQPLPAGDEGAAA